MRPIFLTLALALVACESNEKKAERLRSEMNAACLGVRPYLEIPSWSAATRHEQEGKCDVATRNFNAFTAGR